LVKKTGTTSGGTGSGVNDGTGGNGVPYSSGGDDMTPGVAWETEATAETTTEATVSHTPVIAKIIYLCDFPMDSTMVRFIDQQVWTKLIHVTTIKVGEIKDFHTVKHDGGYEAKPMRIHLRMFEAFLLYYKRKCCELSTLLDDNDVADIMSKTGFHEYCGSDAFTIDNTTGGLPTQSSPNPKFDPTMAGMVSAVDSLFVKEFRRGVKRNKTHYEDLKDDKYFNTWNRGFVATAHMHHTQLVLDENYIPKTNADIAVFKEMQTFMYAVLQDHLKTDKGK
jgi:hypothetical protein